MHPRYMSPMRPDSRTRLSRTRLRSPETTMRPCGETKTSTEREEVAFEIELDAVRADAARPLPQMLRPGSCKASISFDGRYF